MTRWVWTGLGLVVALVILAGARSLITSTGSRAGRTELERPGDFGQVPDFALTDSEGQAVTRKDLLGDYWLADFIFTRCNGVCPILTSRMTALTRELDRVRFVSFTVDPGHDTPEVLARFAAAVPDAARERWLFLTGPQAEIERVVLKGFRLSMATAQEGEAGAEGGDLITHSDRFALVDPEGTIRGYYRGTEEESIARLREDVTQLMRGREARRDR